MLLEHVLVVKDEVKPGAGLPASPAEADSGKMGFRLEEQCVKWDTPTRSLGWQTPHCPERDLFFGNCGGRDFTLPCSCLETKSLNRN
jgi:hypothetical protein